MSNRRNGEYNHNQWWITQQQQYQCDKIAGHISKEQENSLRDEPTLRTAWVFDCFDPHLSLAVSEVVAALDVDGTHGKHTPIQVFKFRLKQAGLSGRINTSFVKRTNLAIHQSVSKLTRRPWGPAHYSLELLEW